MITWDEAVTRAAASARDLDKAYTDPMRVMHETRVHAWLAIAGEIRAKEHPPPLPYLPNIGYR